MRVQDSTLIDEVVARAARPDFDRWIQQVHAAGCCVRPVRLAGVVRAADPATGEARTIYTTSSEPDRLLLKACQSRRATRCPACVQVYRGDARALIIAGLTGGKGVPEAVASNPTVFTTLTAPSFGAVHADEGPCPSSSCAHAQGRCSHLPDDLLVGTPLCPDC